METYNDVPTLAELKANDVKPDNYLVKIVNKTEVEELKKADNSNDTNYSPKICDKGYYCPEGNVQGIQVLCG